MDLKELARRVRDMRVAQTEYSSTPTVAAGRNCRDHQKRVDRIVKEILEAPLFGESDEA